MITQYIDATKQLLYSGILTRLSLPVEIYIETTNICNLRCAYCYKKNLNSKPLYIDINLIRKLLVELPPFSEYPILFVLEGGEPFLHPSFYEITKLIKSFGYPVDILTNGERIDAQKLSMMLNPKIDEVQISLDGITSNAISNRYNNVAKTIESIKELNKLGIIPRINSVITKYNIHDIPDFLNYLNGNVILTSVSLNAVFGKSNRHLFTTDADKLWLTQQLDGKTYNFALYENYDHWTSSSQLCAAQGEFNNEFFRKCTAMSGKICIATNGDVYPCVFYEGRIPPLGNIKTSPIIDIWGSRTADEFVKERDTVSIKCEHCKLNRRCTQKCAGSML